MSSHVIPPQELDALLQGLAADLAIVDCRFTLSDPCAGRKRYLQDHIPGAVYLDLEEDLSGPKGRHGGRHPLPSSTDLAAKLGETGISQDTRVVVYDDGDFMASRLWWLLRYMGHSRVQVLDGGYPAWVAAGYPISPDLPQTEKRVYRPELQEQMRADVDKVRQALNDERIVLLDSREERRYRGEEEPLDPVAGHIPGAKLFSWKEALREDGTWKSAEEQRARLRQAAPSHGEGDGEWILYCGSGVSACANVLALAEAGVERVKLYTGSWSDWCSYPELPVEKG